MAGRPSIIDKKLARMNEMLVKAGMRIDAVYLYGSFAKGKQRRYSDIDVAIISHDYDPSSQEQWRSIYKICMAVDKRIEPVIFRPEDTEKTNPLIDEIKEYGVKVA